ncbi:hypothetical protein [Paraburkholderia caribensis]|uniref:hypothetical protein n=1 Tax=Paraburkholderia caribensis TaxID=75105 RepID=UPI0034D20294
MAITEAGASINDQVEIQVREDLSRKEYELDLLWEARNVEQGAVRWPSVLIFFTALNDQNVQIATAAGGIAATAKIGDIMASLCGRAEALHRRRRAVRVQRRMVFRRSVQGATRLLANRSARASA